MTKRIEISDSVREVLLEIKDSSIIAKMILSDISNDDLVENYVDYLSISESDNTKISYLTADRVEKVRKVGQDIWRTSARFHARPGSVVSKIFKNIAEKDVEIFAKLYKSVLTSTKFKFEIVEGEDIKKYYHYPTYFSGSGSLGNSCMKYDNCQKYMSLYTLNPDVLKMIIMVDPIASKNNNPCLMGRALLWHFGDNKIMDRIYTINDEDLQFHFKKWAIENGYIYKSEQKWNNTLQFDRDGVKEVSKFEFKLNNFLFDRYPYMDTFKFLNRKTGIISNYINESDKDIYSIKTLCGNDGVYYDHDVFQIDDITNLFHHRGEMTDIRYSDGKLIENSSDYKRVYRGNVEWSSINNLNILRQDCKYSEEIDDYIFNDSLDHLNNKDAISKKIEELNDRRKKYDKEREAYIKMMNNTSIADVMYDFMPRRSTLQDERGERVTQEQPALRQESEEVYPYYRPQEQDPVESVNGPNPDPGPAVVSSAFTDTLENSHVRRTRRIRLRPSGISMGEERVVRIQPYNLTSTTNSSENSDL